MDGVIIAMLVFSGVAMIVMLGVVLVVAQVARRSISAPASAGATEPTADTAVDDGEPSDVAALRHHHRYGAKDVDGIRYCRCGDRYLDGMIV